MFTDQNIYQPTMLSSGEAAKQLNVSIQTVRDWTASGKLAATLTTGGHRKYRGDDVAFLALAERGITTYWVDDVVIQMDGEMNVVILGDELEPYTQPNPTEERLERYRRFHNGLERLPRTLALTRQAQVTLPTHAEMYRQPDGTANVQTYLTVAALTRDECARLLDENIPAAVNWLQTSVKPVTGVCSWVTADGQHVRSFY